MNKLKDRVELLNLVKVRYKYFGAFIIVAIFYFALNLVLAPKAHATTYNLKPDSTFNPAADCNIYDAIEAINTKSDVNFCPAGESGSNSIVLEAGTYTLSNAGGSFVGNLPTITSDADLSVIGAGPSTTIVNGNGFTGIKIANDRNYSVSNLTLESFENNATDGTLFQYGGNLTVNSIIVRNNNCAYFSETEANPTCVLFANFGGFETTLTISNSSFYNNTAFYLVGVTSLSGEDFVGMDVEANIFNNTFSNNNSAIFAVINSASLETNVVMNFYNNTVADNNNNGLPFMFSLGWVNGAFPTYGSELNMRNNIFSNNFGYDSESDSLIPTSCPSAEFIVSPSTATSGGGNIISDSTCTGMLNQASDKNNTNPLLDPYVIVNGTGVRPLQAGSPAIGSAVSGTPTTPNTDQRGLARPQGANPDSGAYELQSSDPTPNNNANSLANTGSNTGIPAIVAGILVLAGSIVSGYSLLKRYR